MVFRETAVQLRGDGIGLRMCVPKPNKVQAALELRHAFSSHSLRVERDPGVRGLARIKLRSRVNHDTRPRQIP